MMIGIVFGYFFKAMNFSSFLINSFPEKFSNFKFFVTKKKIRMLRFHVKVDPWISRKFLLTKTDICSSYCVI